MLRRPIVCARRPETRPFPERRWRWKSAAPRSERGLTLTEAVITLVVVGILLAVAVPKLLPDFRQRTVATAADRLILAHSLARATALRYGRVARLNLDPTNRRFWVDVDTSGTGLRQIIGSMQYVNTPGLTITATRTLLCFDARGVATSRGGCSGAADTVTITLDDRSTTLITTSLGKVLR
jgi:Tfp pilus assembly protein FimT